MNSRMNEKRNIVWLASYPKSGNTWFRVFLSNLLNPGNKPVSINEIDEIHIASSRSMFDNITGLPSEDLNNDEIERLRPEVYQFMSAKAEEFFYLKVHGAYTYLPDGRPLFPIKASKAAIYFIRNPLDVAISFAHHNAEDPTKFIQVLNYPHSLSPNKKKLDSQLRQKLSTWSNHIKSWTEQNQIPLLVLRYEDMKNNTFRSFKKAINFLNIESSEEAIQQAIEFSDFSRLKQQEEEAGFKEKTILSESFFRKGSIGEWKNVFKREEIESIIAHHREVLKRFGYLDKNDKLVT